MPHPGALVGAVSPLLAVVAALLFGRSARSAAVAGLAVAIPVVALLFPVGAAQLASAAASWGPVVLEVVLVLAGGILFAEAGRATGDQAVISEWIGASLGSGVVPVLAIVHGFTPLTESLTGYGIGAALAVPLLLGLGYSGGRAAMLGLLGLCAVPWGSMGPGTLIASELTGVGFHELGEATAIFNVVVAVAAGAAAASIAAHPGKRIAGACAGISSGVVFSLAIFASNLLLGTAVAGAVGSATVLAGYLVLRRLLGHRVRVTRPLGIALLPYAWVLGGSLLVPPLSTALGVPGGAVRTALGSPAFWLLTATALVIAVRRAPACVVVRTGGATWVRVAPSTVLFIALGALMGVSGMSEQLALALAELGRSYVFLLPIVAAAVGFITGSNSGANALAAGVQAEVARSLGVDVTLAVGAQNAAGAAAMMASPARVELATRLAQAPDAHREVQRVLLAVLGCGSVSMGVLCLLLL